MHRIPTGRRGRGRKQPAAPPSPPPVQFPLMTVGEIMDDMQLFDYPVEAAAIKAPKTSDAYDIYTFFLREFYGDDVDRQLEPDPNATSAYEYPELFPAAVLARHHFISSLSRMFREACYNDFSITDLEAPVPLRFKYQLSALINYAKYRRSRNETMEELAMKEDEIATKHEELSVGLQKLNAEIRAIEEARKEEQPQVDEHQRIKEQLINEGKALDEKRLELTKYTRERKAELVALAEQVTDLEKKRAKAQSDVTANKRLIVESPERAMAEIKELENELKRAEEAVKTARATRSAHEARRKILYTSVEPLRSCTNLAEKVAGKRKMLTELNQQVVKGKAKERSKKDTIREAEGEIATLQRAIDAMMARRDRLRQVLADHERKASSDEKWWAVQVDELRVFEADCERERNNMLQRIRVIVDETNELVRQVDRETVQVQEKQDELKETTNIHDAQVRETMDMFTTDSNTAFEQLCDMDRGGDESVH